MSLSICAFEKKFLQYSRRFLPWLYSLSFIVSFFAIWLIIKSPYDYQQKLSVKIMYVHVPCAWLALFAYSIMSLAAFFYLYKGKDFFYLLLKETTSLGAIFTALALFSGALWGQLSWGSWWEWDARLTSFLLLFFLYLLLIAVNHYGFEQSYNANLQAVLTLFGALNLPIIKFSVTWWHSLHQSSSFFNKSGISIETAMLIPLLIALISLTLFFTTFLIQALRLAIHQKRLNLLQQKIAIHYQ